MTHQISHRGLRNQEADLGVTQARTNTIPLTPIIYL